MANGVTFFMQRNVCGLILEPREEWIVINVNSAPDEWAMEWSNFHVHGSHL